MSALATLEDHSFGAFQVGNMALALPMTVLREVVPLTPLQKIPTLVNWIVGGLNLRGVLVPVIDLELLYGDQASPTAHPCVIVIAHEGRMVGLLATAVDSLFTAEPSCIKTFHSTDPMARVARGSLHNPLSGQLQIVLCVESLMSLPQLPSVIDPEPHRQTHVLNQAHAQAEEHSSIPLLLMRSGKLFFAVDPSHIETTMPRAQILDSELSDGYYKGNTLYREQEIPAICLLDYLQMKGALLGRNLQPRNIQPAFVLRFREGVLAVLIDEILDIVRIDPTQMISLPSVAVLQPHVLRHTLSKTSIYPDSDSEEHYYVIHPAGLVSDSRLSELARLMHQTAIQRASVQGAVQKGMQLRSADEQRVIVFEMHGDHAVPIGQVAEVLPYKGVVEAFASSHAFRGIMTHRGRAIPVVDLAQHLDLPRQLLNNDSNVLVVRLENDQLIGLAVGSLRSIEQAQWAPTVPVLGAARNAHPGRERTCQSLVEVQVMGELKLLEVIQARDEALRFHHAFVDGSCVECSGVEDSTGDGAAQPPDCGSALHQAETA